MMRRRSQQDDIHCTATRHTHDDEIRRSGAGELDDGGAGFAVDHDGLCRWLASSWLWQLESERFPCVRFEHLLKLGDRSGRYGYSERPLDRTRHDQSGRCRSRQALRERNRVVASRGQVRRTQNRFER
jgi:hypothetical protein